MAHPGFPPTAAANRQTAKQLFGIFFQKLHDNEDCLVRRERPIHLHLDPRLNTI